MIGSDSGFSVRPGFEGTLEIGRVPSDVFERIQRRIAEGLLVPGRRTRANYRVLEAGSDKLTFAADDFATAYAIGLNHVELERVPGGISYRVRFDRWNRSAVAHAFLVGLLLTCGYLLSARVRAQVESAGAAWLFWGAVSFWALIWPWVLTGIHRRYARATLEEILLEESSDEPREQAAS